MLIDYIVTHSDKKEYFVPAESVKHAWLRAELDLEEHPTGEFIEFITHPETGEKYECPLEIKFNKIKR